RIGIIQLRIADSGFWIVLLSDFRYLLSGIPHRRVSPGECGFTSSDGDPGTNGVISKTRCGVENEHHGASNASAIMLRRFRPAIHWRMPIFSGNAWPAFYRFPRSLRR